MADKKNLVIGLIAVFVIALAWIQKPKSETYSAQAFTLTVSGRQRNYLVYGPKNFSNKQAPVPAVIILHGGGGPMGSAQMMADTSGWPQKAAEEKFLAVFPNGTLRDSQKEVELKGNIQEWSDGSGRSLAEQTGVDDVTFIDALIDDVLERFFVDRQRIYVTGFSNGASMTFRIGGALSDRIAAIAPVAGVLSLPSNADGSSVSLLYISGSEDKRPQTQQAPSEKTAASKSQLVVWAESLGCPKQAKIGTKDANIKTILYAPCRGGSEVAAYTIQGMGHVYPGAQTELWEQGADNPANDIMNATDVIWDFFKRHKKS